MKARFVNEDSDWRYDDPDYVMINGEWMNKNSREYQRWYEEEGEFDDTEGREYRRNRFYEDVNEGYGQKDLVRMEDIRTKSAGDHDKEIALASTQARLITKAPKAKARAEAAEQVFGPGSDIANIFGERAIELGGSYVSSKASSGTLAPLSSAEPKAERKFRVQSHIASERVKKGGDAQPAQTGGFVRGGGVKSAMGIGKYADAPETSNDYIYGNSAVASLGKVDLATGDSKYFNVKDNWETGTVEIWQDYKGNYKAVFTSNDKPGALIGNRKEFMNDQTWKPVTIQNPTWKMVDYAPVSEMGELVRLYGASLTGYTYK